jgi:hypothetical protein
VRRFRIEQLTDDITHPARAVEMVHRPIHWDRPEPTEVL